MLVVRSVIWVYRVVIFCPMEERLMSILFCMSARASMMVSFAGKVSVVEEGASGDKDGCGLLGRITELSF